MVTANAAAPLAAVTAAAAAHPDADLLQLAAHYSALDSSATAYAVDLERIEEEVEAAGPPMPEVLRVTSNDRAVWSFSAPWWTAHNVNLLRKQVARLQRHVAEGATEGKRGTLKRAQEVVSASDQREAAYRARLASTRHPAVEKAYDDALESLGLAWEQILATRARTLAGLQVKARLLGSYLGGPPTKEADVDEDLTWSLLSDLLALEETA